jgi:hypothetical protein
METYTHRPMSGQRNARLLQLHASLDFQAPLKCDLTEGSLSDDGTNWQSETYEALSYFWGPPSTQHFVEIEGKRLPITANCDAALRHLRRRSRSCTLWVDAICINQKPEATEERNSQVAMMGEIYSAAKTVLIWLGESSGQWTKDYFSFLELLSQGGPEVDDLAQKIREADFNHPFRGPGS